ncbi:TIGR02281 family clan AA aspartic protease [Thioalkalivibrio sp.]|uniref:retropepsin-like aspartic protease family protein n=1 Tax=Thioalkalivibrio sp. TaxID=2093813 RepID=UPI003565B1C8
MHRRRWARRILTLLLCPLLPVAGAAELRVQGLFEGRALFAMDGERFMLRDGQTGPQGVHLLRATSEAALVEYEGQRRELTLERGRFGGVYQRTDAELRIPPDARGGYIVRGLISGQTVTFVVDTGATLVTLSDAEARRLNLRPAGGVEVAVETASGIVTGRRILLDRVQVGGLALDRVEAVVLPGESPATALLGMSFLGRVDMQKEGSLLVLRAR